MKTFKTLTNRFTNLSKSKPKISTTTLFLLLGTLVFTSCKKHVPISERFKGYDENSFVVTLPQLAPLITKEGDEIGVTASDCAGCHSEIYHEWSMSTHATALADIQYQAELSKESSPKWLCLNCHIPVQNQREHMVQKETKILYLENDVRHIKKEENPNFDPDMQEEAITCAVCHIRQDDKGASYVIGSHGSELAPHPVKKDRDGLRNICERCHSPGTENLTTTFACWFKTKEELETGPYAGEKGCVDCHMPSIQRKAVPHDEQVPVREGHGHHWVGGGVPKWYEAYDTILERGYEPGLEVKLKSVSKSKSKVTLNLHYKNAIAGHWLPTGDPERFLLFRVALVDKSGQELAVETMHVGQEWDWGDANEGRPAKKLHDNRLKPKEERDWRVEINAPEGAPLGELRAEITVLHVRLKGSNAKYMVQAQGINETYLPDGQELVKNAIDHYPFASFIYKQVVTLKNMKKRVLSPKELIELSKGEQGKAIDERVY